MLFWLNSDQLDVDLRFEATSLAQASELIGRAIDTKHVVSFENRNFGGMSYVTVVNFGLLVECRVAFERFWGEEKGVILATDPLGEAGLRLLE